MRYFTFRKAALAVKKAWQTLRFATGKGYWLHDNWPLATEITMYDAIDLTQVPVNAQAVAGYVDGRWPTFYSLATRFPKARLLSIAVFASEDADCLDVEPGDASVAQAPVWVKRQLAAGVKRPVVYTSVSQAKGLLDTLAKNGISRSQIRLWTAHYTFKAHRCTSACGFGFTGKADATQYSDHALGKNLDVSLCAPDFFPPEV